MKPNSKQYRISIEWSDDDEAYVARVPAFEGCISHGDTPEEALRNIQDALAGVLESISLDREPSALAS